jgi:indole-3-glycerol phosphate synthase
VQLKDDYLTKILKRKQAEVEIFADWAAELAAQAASAPPARPWALPLKKAERVALIAEIKRRAPSAGSLRPDLDPRGLARAYEAAGAAAISVLTDQDFDGKLSDLEAARDAVNLPVLRKDFILDKVQVYESRAAGADAVLLIARALSDAQLVDLLGLAREVGLGTLVEVHDEDELGRALNAGAPVIGVNNRDLRTFTTDLDITRKLVDSVPPDRILVSESGIEAGEHVSELGALGVDAVLVGRALVSQEDPGALARELASQPKVERA